MMDEELKIQFSKVDLSVYPDLYQIAKMYQLALWVLYVAEKEKINSGKLTAKQIAYVITKVFKCKRIIYTQIARIFNATSDLVDTEKENGKTYFYILKKGEMIVKAYSPKKQVAEQVIGLHITELVKTMRGYIIKPAEQIDGCYDKEWYDACAVMIRRLIETLIIECFEAYGIQQKIKDSDGHFFMLEKLIDCLLKETNWTIGRNATKYLPRFKSVGDNAAHNRRFITKKADIDDIKQQLRVVIEELLILSKLQ